MTARLDAIAQCTTVAQIDKLIRERRRSKDQPTDAERWAWRKRRAEMNRKGTE
jgi:hypothetical protein